MLYNDVKCKQRRSITPSQYDQYRAKWRRQQKHHQKKLDRLSETDEQYYVTVSYLLDIAAKGKELLEPCGSLQDMVKTNSWLTTIENVITVIKKDIATL